MKCGNKNANDHSSLFLKTADQKWRNFFAVDLNLENETMFDEFQIMSFDGCGEEFLLLTDVNELDA